MKKIIAALSVLIVLPIWFWLVYQILTRVEASELMWFLYWVYVPASLLVSTLAKIADDE